MKPIRIALADKYTLVRQGTASLLAKEQDFEVTFEAENGADLMEKLRKNKTDIVLLDLTIPTIRGREVYQIVKERHPEIKLILIAGTFLESQVVYLVREGIYAFLSKTSCFSQAAEAIRTVHNGGAFFDNSVTKILADQIIVRQSVWLAEEMLTKQEIKIVAEICSHYTSKEIADHLSLSRKTIEWHRGRIMRKLGVRNVTGLMEFAIRTGIVLIAPQFTTE